MAQVTIDEAMRIAIGHQQASRWVEAERVYRLVLAQVPDQADALHLLGVLSCQRGHTGAATELIGRAITINPAVPEYHSNLGESWRRAGQREKAIASFRRAIELKPDLAEAHNSLGIALREQGQPDLAVAAYTRAIELKPDFAEAHNNLGNALSDEGRLDLAIAAINRAIELKPDYAEALCNLGNAQRQNGRLELAIAACNRAIELKPDLAEAHNNLGIALKDQGRYDAAIAAINRAIELRPNYAEAHSNLGIALSHQGQPELAIAAINRAIELKPDYAEAHSNLGTVLRNQGRLDLAIAAYNRAIELKPDYAEAHNNLGTVLKDTGRLDLALACFRTALERKPSFASAASNLVCTLHYHPGYDAGAILAEHRRWEAQFATPLARLIRPHSNEPAPDRRLRIGYVSPDFHSHVVGLNLLPLFREHDHHQFEIFCYADVIHPDHLTQRFQALADVWRNLLDRTGDQVAQLVREDRIDVLVDFTLHTADNRLLVFARKPAPVQVSFAGYPATTGLSAIDYRLTDPYLDPPGLDDPDSAEEPVRLPASFWCYDPLTDEPEVNSLPAHANGFITFGCLNNFVKVNDRVLALWARVQRAVEGSRLLLLAPEGQSRRDTVQRLEREGIALDRVAFVPHQPRLQYLKLYHGIDLMLDTFPYNGHTTSLDALWMGVPVVTLVGGTTVGRAGLSQLTNLGLPELVAQEPEEFVRIAVQLAGDLPRLAGLRATLRDRMQGSPLMDAPRFARGIEAAYRTMWHRWCARPVPPRPE